MSSVTADEILARMTGITKRFGHVTVLQDVPFDVRAGEVHVLAGENGAGKSTLIKILGGVHADFEGQLELSGRVCRPRSPLEASRLGVAVIHQELSLVPAMSVADNIFLGRTPARAGFVRRAYQREAAREQLATLGVELDVERPAGDFPLATQQLIEIAKALSQQARVLVMDEPTSALSAPEVVTLFELIGQLKSRGCGIVYISHKMEEIERIADRITVLRDGRHVGTAPAAELPPARLIAWMVGRELQERFLRHAPHPGAVRLELRDFSVYPRGPNGKASVESVSLSVRAGEILGLGGLQGSGASDLLWGLFGALGRNTRGQMLLDGRPAQPRTPRQAIRAGLALLTNDRKATGLVLSLPIVANATLASLRPLSPGGWLRPARERAAAAQTTQQLRLRAASLDVEVGTLSGGNQQKVALAKWLQTAPRVLLLDEPTRGIDVGAKREIYELMNQWTAAGIAILLITSEMPELLALSDQIAVLHRGRITARFERHQATPERVLRAAMGNSEESVR